MLRYVNPLSYNHSRNINARCAVKIDQGCVLYVRFK